MQGSVGVRGLGCGKVGVVRAKARAVPSSRGLRLRGRRDQQSLSSTVVVRAQEEEGIQEVLSKGFASAMKFVESLRDEKPPSSGGGGGAPKSEGDSGVVGSVVQWVNEQIYDKTEGDNRVTLVDEDLVSRVKAPDGVTFPTQSPKLPKLTMGFTHMAERWNSRASMVGFFSLLFIELVTGKGLLELLGLQVGNGLGFEL
ncbi:chlorophyll a/b binding domain-containing protein [Chloropicon primus]|nr:chlorophyll a/b binding domain-containing protein [Chloropicon primus]UPR02320.1 chlorophyll a/b binding domain-containing protein [Chloropicon primus]|eukprot:QDZ23106.1 chlorophyll a/b binding domain-containing protein [Chloropicon primus]